MCYLLGRMCYFAALGLLAIVAVGPVVGIVGALLPFAVVGLVAYGLSRAVGRLFGRRDEERTGARPLAVEPVPVAVREVDVRPAPVQRPFRGRVVLEVLCGGLVGGLVAGAVAWQTPDLAGTVFPAVAAGAVVGYLVGGSSTDRGRTRCTGEAC